MSTRKRKRKFICPKVAEEEKTDNGDDEPTLSTLLLRQQSAAEKKGHCRGKAAQRTTREGGRKNASQDFTSVFLKAARFSSRNRRGSVHWRILGFGRGTIVSPLCSEPGDRGGGKEEGEGNDGEGGGMRKKISIVVGSPPPRLCPEMQESLLRSPPLDKALGN